MVATRRQSMMAQSTVESPANSPAPRRASKAAKNSPPPKQNSPKTSPKSSPKPSPKQQATPPKPSPFQNKREEKDSPKLPKPVPSDKKEIAASLLKQREEHDKYSRIFFEPHTIIGLALLLGFGVFAAFQFQSKNTAFNIKIGMGYAGVVFLFYAATQFPDTLFIRPHPVFWRMVTGASILYLSLLTFALFQNHEDANAFIAQLDTSLGKPLPEVDYATHCELTLENIKDVVFDEFVLAHIIGFWGKFILVRDVYVTLILSVGFEILELTFMHILENFKECWWDRYIVDLLICNMLGIYLGHLTVKYMAGREYQWSTVSHIKGTKGKLKRVIGQLGPFTWDKETFELLSGPKRFMQILFLCAIVLLNEINAFFLKSVLDIPPSNNINSARLFLWWCCGQLAVREWLHFISDPDCHKIGAHTWVSVAGVIMETLVWLKYGKQKGLFEGKEWPTTVLVSWTVGLVVFFGWYFYFFAIKKHHQLPEK